MATIQYDWFVDYYNQLIVHASMVVFYTGTGSFTVGETVTWTGGSAVVVGEDTTNNMLFLVYPTGTPSGTITGSTSGATCTYASSTSMVTKTINYDTSGTGGLAADTRINIGSAKVTVINDDTTNSILTVKYVDSSAGAIADNDIIYSDLGVTDTGARVNGIPTTSNTTYTARQLYSFIQDTFDELIAMDDTVPMSAQTPTEFTLINGWFIDDESTKYLRGGAISSSGWTDTIQIVTLDSGTLAYTNATPDDIGSNVVSDPTGTPTTLGALLHYNNTDQKWWIRYGSTIADNTELGVSGGNGQGTAAGASSTGETLYANIYTLGTIATDPNPQTYVFQNSAAIDEWWGLGDSEAHIDVLIKVKEADTLIDSGHVTVYARRFGDLYDHFTIDLSTGGRNAVPLATGTDLNNNESGEITIAYSGSPAFTVGNFVRDTTTGAHGEILADNGSTVTVGNVKAGSTSPYTFVNTNSINETIDGTAAGDTGQTGTNIVVSNVVRDYNDIGIYFVNASFNFDAGTAAPTLYERIYQGAGGGTDPSGYVLDYSTTSGTWGGGDAAGTITIGNWNSITFADNVAITGTGTFAATANNPTGETYVSSINKAFEQGTAYPYNVIVECANRTMAEVYEWFKYVTREDANTSQPASFNHITMYPVNDISNPTAIVEEDGEEYISASTTYTPVKASPFGTLAGGTLFGATGVWVEGMAESDRQNFQLIDAGGSTRTPPNFIVITVNSVVAGDKISVFRTSSGATINKSQFTSGAGNTLGGNTFTVSSSIPSDTPNSGYIRVVDVDDTSINRESRYAYSSWTSNTFTLSGTETLDRNYTSGTDTAYVPYFDEVAGGTSVSVTVIYNADQTVLTRVRLYDGGTPSNSILPFQITGTVTSSGYSVAAIRTADTIVTTYP
ncbi:MAG: hypothetical protein D6698_02700 [Gammaproteobacteria bacterium]|nr:MAG: hypothetical protein D6698_02700 [Gammaproteobacteria bacterium]